LAPLKLLRRPGWPGRARAKIIGFKKSEVAGVQELRMRRQLAT
jgi:hypothetical protein